MTVAVAVGTWQGKARRLSVWAATHPVGAITLLCAAVTLALRIPAFTVREFNSDEAFLATQAGVLRHGGALYLNAVDRKPPLVPYLYAAVFWLTGSRSLIGVRVLAMAVIVGTAVLLAVEARRRYGLPAAWFAGLLFVLATVSFAPQDGQAANFEFFMLPGMTAAVVLAARGRAGPAGICLALATLAKQTAVASALPVAYLLWQSRGMAGLRRSTVTFLGTVIAAALFVGPGNLLYWAALGNGSYLGNIGNLKFVAFRFLLQTFLFVVAQLPILYLLPRAWRRGRGASPSARRDLDLWLWLVSGCLAVALGFRFFGHYYLQLLPPLCLLTAGALATVAMPLRKLTIGIAAAIATVFSATGYFTMSQPPYQAVSRFLVSHSGPTDRIFVWGQLPEIYWATGEQPATRFVTTSFLTGASGGRPAGLTVETAATAPTWDLFVSDFESHPPRYIVDTAPGHIRSAQYYPMNQYPRLEALVRTEYRYVKTIDRIVIYERLPGVKEQAAPAYRHEEVP